VPTSKVGTADHEGRGIFIITPLPRAALRLPWATIFRPYGASGLARSARKRPERPKLSDGGHKTRRLQ
jgi:hypothetical protein